MPITPRKPLTPLATLLTALNAAIAIAKAVNPFASELTVAGGILLITLSSVTIPVTINPLVPPFKTTIAAPKAANVAGSRSPIAVAMAPIALAKPLIVLPTPEPNVFRNANGSFLPVDLSKLPIAVLI